MKFLSIISGCRPNTFLQKVAKVNLLFAYFHFGDDQ